MYVMLVISLLYVNPSAAQATSFTDPVGDTFDERGFPAAADPYVASAGAVDIVEVEVALVGADLSVRVKMNGPLPNSLTDSISMEWDLLVDIDQNPATRGWGPYTLMDNGIGVDRIVRLMLGPRGAGYRADVYDPTKKTSVPVEFKIDGPTAVLKCNSLSFPVPKTFDYVFAVGVFGEYGRVRRAIDKAPNQGYFTFEGGKTTLREFTTTADELFNTAVGTINLINRNLRDPATGAYYTDARQDWTAPTSPTLYAQTRMISALLQLYLATKNDTYLAYAKGAQDFVEKQLRTTGGAYQSASNDSSIDVFIDAQAVLALMKMHEVAGDSDAMKRAGEVADFILARMSDKTNGGFFNRVWENGTTTESSPRATWYQETTVLMLATLYGITKNATYLEYAEKTQALIDKYLWIDGVGYWCYAAGNWTRAYLDREVSTYYRQAWSVRALTALYVATGKTEYIQRAKKTADTAGSYWNLGYSCHDVIFSNGTRWVPWNEIYFSYEVEALTELAKATGEDVYLRYAKRSLDRYVYTLADKTQGGLVMARSRYDSKRGNFSKSTVYQSKAAESILLYGSETRA